MFRKKTLWIALIIVIAATIGGYYYYNRVHLPAQIPEESPIQTATVRRGDLVIFASGVGTVIPSTEIELGFPKGGELVEVSVQVGDEVSAGDVLMRVDDSDARQGVANAELQVVKAQSDLAAAEEKLSDLQAGTSEADLLNAQAALASAEESYDRVIDGPDQTEIEKKELSLSKAKNSLWSAQLSRDSAGGRADEGGLSTSYDSAQASVANAEVSVRLAEIDLEELLEPASEAEIADAKAKLAQAKEKLEDLLAAPADDDLATVEAQVEQARLSLANAELSREAAQRDLEETALIAPIDGTIMEVKADAGERVGSNAIVTLADTSHPLIEIYLDESDLGAIQVGYEVEVVLDALPDELFTGRVVRLDPFLISIQNVSTIRALAELDATSFAKPQGLLMQMSAAVDVIGGRAEGVLLVPVEALRETSPGQYAVFVVEEGELELCVVEVGLMDYTSAEIVSGLKLGDVVSTGIVETK